MMLLPLLLMGGRRVARAAAAAADAAAASAAAAAGGGVGSGLAKPKLNRMPPSLLLRIGARIRLPVRLLRLFSRLLTLH
jgi:hypothetical protein